VNLRLTQPQLGELAEESGAAYAWSAIVPLEIVCLIYAY